MENDDKWKTLQIYNNFRVKMAIQGYILANNRNNSGDKKKKKNWWREIARAVCATLKRYIHTKVQNEW